MKHAPPEQDARQLTPVLVRVVIQGAPIVNDGYIHARGDSVVAIYIDMRSKRCRVGATGGGDDGPKIEIEADGDGASLHLDESQPRDAVTWIALPEFIGWQVFCAELSRYTLAVCLVKEN